jgi:hypothetical protein
VAGRDGASAQLEGELGEVAELAGGDEGVAAHLADRAAVVGHVAHGELLSVLGHHAGDLLDDARPVERAECAPGWLGGRRSPSGVIDVRIAAARYARDRLTGGRGSRYRNCTQSLW